MKPAKAIQNRSLLADATSIKAKPKRRKRKTQRDGARRKITKEGHEWRDGNQTQKEAEISVS